MKAQYSHCLVTSFSQFLFNFCHLPIHLAIFPLDIITIYYLNFKLLKHFCRMLCESNSFESKSHSRKPHHNPRVIMGEPVQQQVVVVPQGGVQMGGYPQQQVVYVQQPPAAGSTVGYPATNGTQGQTNVMYAQPQQGQPVVVHTTVVQQQPQGQSMHTQIISCMA